VPPSYPINAVYLWMSGPEEAVMRVSLKRGVVRVEELKRRLRELLPAHLREWVRPLRGVKCGYLDDLFVDPQHRGSGIVDALYDAMRALAAERRWPVIRWTTADDNYRARAVYDRLATRTLWITYDMATE